MFCLRSPRYRENQLLLCNSSKGIALCYPDVLLRTIFFSRFQNPYYHVVGKSDAIIYGIRPRGWYRVLSCVSYSQFFSNVFKNLIVCHGFCLFWILAFILLEIWDFQNFEYHKSGPLTNKCHESLTRSLLFCHNSWLFSCSLGMTLNNLLGTACSNPCTPPCRARAVGTGIQAQTSTSLHFGSIPDDIYLSEPDCFVWSMPKSSVSTDFFFDLES